MYGAVKAIAYMMAAVSGSKLVAVPSAFAIFGADDDMARMLIIENVGMRVMAARWWCVLRFSILVISRLNT